jgi:carbon-monoxide dehydrogenase large subunit
LRSLTKPIHPLLKEASFQATDWYPLAWDKVRYMGEAVAVVVAVDRYQAEDATEHVLVEYEPLPAITSATAGLAAGSPLIHEELASNVLLHVNSGAKQDQAAFENAEVRVRGTFQHPRVTGLAIENCGVLADYRRETDELIVWSSTQVPHQLRDALSECLNHSTHKLRVIAPNVGGGFGIKMQALPEEVAIAYLARHLGRPVRWTQDRLENLQASFHARDSRVEAELVAHSDGTIIGLRAKALCDVGAYNSFPLTCALEPFTIGGALPGPYRFPYYAYEGYAVATNKCPVGAYRGVGFVLGPLVMEGLMDKLAHKLELDPAEIRQKNLARPEEFPFTSPAGPVYDSGDYTALLDLARKQANYPAWRQQQQSARAEGRLLGIGLSCFVEVTGMGRGTYRKRGMVNIPAFDSAILRVDRRGHLEAFISTPSQGQGQCTTFAQLLAQEMGLPFAAIRIHLGDTATCPYGSGTFASRSLVSGGGALLKAAGKLREKLSQLAAAHWRVDPSQVTYAGGAATFHGNSSGQRHVSPDRGLTLYELAQLAYTPFQELPPDIEPGLEVHCAYDPPSAATSAAVHLALVEVDAGTGQVTVHGYVAAEDCGRILNQKIVDGQVRGGIVQGIGTALWEEIVYDEQGQLLSGSLLDYLVPGAYESPRIQIVHIETPSPWTEGGFKGVGESGTIGAPAAITNAVLDALGVNPTHVRLPLTPERVLRLKQEARQRK